MEIVIFQHFGIEKYDKEEIIHADKIALYMEIRDIVGKSPGIWRESKHYLSLLPKQKIIPLSPKKSEKLFLKKYEKLN